MINWLLAGILAAGIAHAHAAPELIEGRVVGVADGDTLTVLTPGRTQHTIRLAEIDAPESRMPFGARSKQSLSALCYMQAARVEIVDIDRYKRVVGKVECEGRNANHAQVESGMAWVYRKYAKDPGLIKLENDARTAKRGLWSDAAPTPPWEWRRANRR